MRVDRKWKKASREKGRKKERERVSRLMKVKIEIEYCLWVCC